MKHHLSITLEDYLIKYIEKLAKKNFTSVSAEISRIILQVKGGVK